MLTSLKFVNKVFDPTMGLLIFGGDPLTSNPVAMKLESLGSSWTAGPDLFQRSVSLGQCLLQVNTTWALYNGCLICFTTPTTPFLITIFKAFTVLSGYV